MDNQRLMEVGGFAFPASGPVEGGGTFTTFGMTMRDWFAGQALTGILSGETKPSDVSAKVWPDAVAVSAYMYADAMLAASGNG